MSWVRLLKAFTNKKGKKFPIGHIWNMNGTQAAEWVKKKKAEYCDRNDDKLKTEFFKPK